MDRGRHQHVGAGRVLTGELFAVLAFRDGLGIGQHIHNGMSSRSSVVVSDSRMKRLKPGALLTPGFSNCAAQLGSVGKYDSVDGVDDAVGGFHISDDDVGVPVQVVGEGAPILEEKTPLQSTDPV